MGRRLAPPAVDAAARRRRRGRRGRRKGANGVSTHWVTANFRHPPKFITFAAAPLVSTPFVRNQGRRGRRGRGVGGGAAGQQGARGGPYMRNLPGIQGMCVPALLAAWVNDYLLSLL